MYRSIFDSDRTALDSAHIQHIIDQAKQMLAGCVNLFQIIQNHLPTVNMCCRECRKSDDGVHRRADIMRHIIQKCCLCLVRMFRLRKCISQIFILFYLTFFFFCRITIRNQNSAQISVFIVSLRHNEHNQPSFIHCLRCKTQYFTAFQTLFHCTRIDKFPICLPKWLCNNLTYQFFLMFF